MAEADSTFIESEKHRANWRGALTVLRKCTPEPAAETIEVRSQYRASNVECLWRRLGANNVVVEMRSTHALATSSRLVPKKPDLYRTHWGSWSESPSVVPAHFLSFANRVHHIDLLKTHVGMRDVHLSYGQNAQAIIRDWMINRDLITEILCQIDEEYGAQAYRIYTGDATLSLEKPGADFRFYCNATVVFNQDMERIQRQVATITALHLDPEVQKLVPNYR